MAKQERLYGVLQFDLQGSSDIDAPDVQAQQAKERLLMAICGVAALYDGEELSSGGDGQAFLLPVYDVTKCPMDSLALAALHALRTVQFLNESWNPWIPLKERLSVRISCDKCAVTVDEENLPAAHGPELNWFLKGEREIGRPDAVTITSKVYNEIQSPSLRELFIRRDNPYSAKARGEVITQSLYVYSEEAGESLSMTWDEYTDAVTKLADKLASDSEQGGFDPELIVGIAGGGLIAADLLSRKLRRVPLIMLWADRDYDHAKKQIEYKSPYNQLSHLRTLLQQGQIRRILIVDDLCQSGGSLDGALQLVNAEVKRLTKKIQREMAVKTAVVAKAKKFDGERTVSLDYCILENKELLPYGK